MSLLSACLGLFVLPGGGQLVGFFASLIQEPTLQMSPFSTLVLIALTAWVGVIAYVTEIGTRKPL